MTNCSSSSRPPPTAQRPPSRLLIVGSGGAGKSTLARRLGDRTGLPVIHLDRLFWKPGWVESTREEFDARLAEALAGERWIMDGNYSRTMPQRLEAADTVVMLDFSRFACMYGILSRAWRHRGEVRPDMSEGCPEKIDWEFAMWVWNYPKRSRPEQIVMLDAAARSGKQVVILRSRHQVDEWLERQTGA